VTSVSLGDEHPIERVTVDHGQLAQPAMDAVSDREPEKTGSFNHRIDIESNRLASGLLLDHNFATRQFADISRLSCKPLP
jgi:hypothetical protein